MMELTFQQQQQILIAAASVAGVLLLIAFAGILKARKAKRLVLAAAARTDQLAAELDLVQQSLTKSLGDVDALTRRLDLFEATHREAVVEPLVEGPPAENMTERRHRVVALAARGQAPDMIASTIGMLTGEVELILSLDHASRRAHIQ